MELMKENELHRAFWNQIREVTAKLNDDSYQAEWKDGLLANHKPSRIKWSVVGSHGTEN